MEFSPNPDEIISEANHWTFKGDCVLLEWMEHISQNLLQHATSTIQGLQDLNANVECIATSLDNVGNSLQQLQYSQFVESRCQDEDNDIAKRPIESNEKPSNSTGDNLKTFLQNNLEMLHSCYEKYPLDFDDSEDEDAVTNYIYQPKNPYNTGLLPHIFGTKLWTDEWHAGLGDQSGGEMSESSSSGDNESYDSNTVNHSQWTSSVSTLNEKESLDIGIQNVSSINGSQTLFPVERNIPSTLAKQTSPSNPTSLTIPKVVTKQCLNESDLFASLEKTSQVSAAPEQHTVRANNEQWNNVKDCETGKNLTAPLFDDVADLILNQSKKADLEQKKISRTPTKRIPVNLFGDNDDDVGVKQVIEKTNEPAFKPGDKTIVDLFDSSRHSPTEVLQSVSSERKEPIAKNEPLNLFDSPEFSESPFPYGTKSVENRNKEFVGKSRFTAKSLFDDDDDEFLSIFGTKKDTTASLIGKTLVFSNENDGAEIISAGANERQQEIPNSTMKKFPLDEVATTEIKSILYDTESGNAVSDGSTSTNHHTGQKEGFSAESNIIRDKNKGQSELTQEIKTDPIEVVSNKRSNYLFEYTDQEASNVSSSEVSLFPNYIETEKENFEDEIPIKQNSTDDTSNRPMENDVKEVHEINEKTKSKMEKSYLLESILDEEYNENDLFDKFINTENTIDAPLPEKPLKNDTHLKNEVVDADDETLHLNDENKHSIIASSSCAPIFFDEPPDDHDFFQSLSTNTLSTSTFALESDNTFFPAEKIEPNKSNIFGINDYTSLSLFNEIPPDDDGGGAFSLANDKIRDGAGELHNPFSSDVNENFTSFEKSYEVPTHSLFDNEPPPDIETPTVTSFDVQNSNFHHERLGEDFVDRTAPLKQDETASSTNVQLEFTPTSSGDDNLPKELEQFAIKSVKLLTHNLENSLFGTEEKQTYVKSGQVSGVSKLQLPKININVQGLLPKLVERSHFKEPVIENTTTDPEQHLNTSSAVLPEAKSILLPKPTQDNIEESSNSQKSHEYILKNACKNRVRGPAKRPSSRRGRQESYRKSLTAESEPRIPHNREPSYRDHLEDGPEIIEQKLELPRSTVKQPFAEEKKNLLLNPKETFPKYSKTRPEPCDFFTANPQSSETTEYDVFEDFNASKNATKSTLPIRNLEAHKEDKSALVPPRIHNPDNIRAIKSVVPTEKLVPKKPSRLNILSESYVCTNAGGGAGARADPVTEYGHSNRETTKSLFGEQTDSDDDLFKTSKPRNIKTTVKSNNNDAKAPQSTSTSKRFDEDSIFGTDSEDNDDFLNSIRIRKNKKAKTSDTIKTVNDGGLFKCVASDDDDDDNLFCSKAPKATTKSSASEQWNHTIGKRRGEKSEIARNDSAPLENNPLADLLHD